MWAAFWGSPVAAGIIMAINYSRVGRSTAAKVVFVGALAATAALLALIFAIPEDFNIPAPVFLIPQLILVYTVASSLQTDIIGKHADRGGRVASAWPSVWVGILCLPLVFGAIFGMAILVEPSIGTLVEFGNDEVYYSGEATEADARKLAGVLQDTEFFGSGGATVTIEASSARYTISFILVNDAWKDVEVVDAFRAIGGFLVESEFPSPVVIQLCDDYFVVHKELVIE